MRAKFGSIVSEVNLVSDGVLATRKQIDGRWGLILASATIIYLVGRVDV